MVFFNGLFVFKFILIMSVKFNGFLVVLVFKILI